MSKRKKFSPEIFEKELENDSIPYLIAKKEFVISHNGYERHIKEGEDISDIPSVYYDNLRTENVI